jgi:tRNA threonylcarbamoyladenosine biosynthesis protein TsaB
LLILAFETSAKAASVALHDGSKLLAESYQNTGLTHSQTLMVMAEDMLKQCGYTARDVTHVAVAAGPGSFTGVRIGVAAAKGLAWGLQAHCYGVSTLEAMAKNFGLADGVICACMDARRNQVYNALFRVEKGVCSRLTEDRAISLADLAGELVQLEDAVYLVGDGSLVAKAALGEGVIAPAEHRMHQRAAGVAMVAAEMIAAGLEGDAEALQPNYLRLSQAEREKLERQGKQ